jgi:tetratricopeptide (TPR) repeat protein
MKRGILLLNESTPASLKEAIANFDRAIQLRRNLPLAANPLFRYGLAAGWMNRGDALRRLGSDGHLAEALRSYDAALEVLSGLSMEANPLFARRLAIAWQNRGLVWQDLRPGGARTEAQRSFETALAILQGKQAVAITDRHYLLATAWTNYANALISGGASELAPQARRAAEHATALAAQMETEDSSMAEAGLKARHVFCQTIAQSVLAKDLSDCAKAELISQATDAVDSGLAVARQWEQRNITSFRLLARELFHFGARAYQMSQPHFLTEFLLENLDPGQSAGAFADDSAMHTAALESLWRAFCELQTRNPQTINAPDFSGFLGKLHELSLAEERLMELRRQFLSQ